MAEDAGSRRDVEAGESPNSAGLALAADASATATLGSHQWPTVDGPLGVYHEEAVKLAKVYYHAGFLLNPLLWFINCFYFWPVLQNARSDPLIRPYVVKSGIGFLVYGTLLLAWSLTFAYGGEELFGPSWRSLAVYSIAEKYSQHLFPYQVATDDTFFTSKFKLIVYAEDVCEPSIRTGIQLTR